MRSVLSPAAFRKVSRLVIGLRCAGFQLDSAIRSINPRQAVAIRVFLMR